MLGPSQSEKERSKLKLVSSALQRIDWAITVSGVDSTQEAPRFQEARNFLGHKIHWQIRGRHVCNGWQVIHKPKKSEPCSKSGETWRRWRLSTLLTASIRSIHTHLRINFPYAIRRSFCRRWNFEGKKQIWGQRTSPQLKSRCFIFHF